MGTPSNVGRNPERCADSARRDWRQCHVQQFSQTIPLLGSELKLIAVFKLSSFP